MRSEDVYLWLIPFLISILNQLQGETTQKFDIHYRREFFIKRKRGENGLTRIKEKETTTNHCTQPAEEEPLKKKKKQISSPLKKKGVMAAILS